MTPILPPHNPPLRRVLRWMKDRGTAVIMTGEMGTTPA